MHRSFGVKIFLFQKCVFDPQIEENGKRTSFHSYRINLLTPNKFSSLNTAWFYIITILGVNEEKFLK